MGSVWISRKVILAEVFKGVGYTLQKYNVCAISGGKFVGSVAFFVGGNGANDVHGPETCYGLPEATLEGAEESAAFHTIKLITGRLNVDVKDLNYDEKFVLKCENSRYELNAEIKDQTIASLSDSMSQFEDGWNCMIEQVEGLFDNMSLRIFDDHLGSDNDPVVDANVAACEEAVEHSLKVVIAAGRKALSAAQLGGFAYVGLAELVLLLFSRC